jgi:hypothetical protein
VKTQFQQGFAEYLEKEFTEYFDDKFEHSIELGGKLSHVFGGCPLFTLQFGRIEIRS